MTVLGVLGTEILRPAIQGQLYDRLSLVLSTQPVRRLDPQGRNFASLGCNRAADNKPMPSLEPSPIADAPKPPKDAKPPSGTIAPALPPVTPDPGQIDGTVEAPAKPAAVAPAPAPAAVAVAVATSTALPGKLDMGLAGEFDPPPAAPANARTPVGKARSFSGSWPSRCR